MSRWLAYVPGTLGMICPACDSRRVARRMAIDPPSARLVFYPCTEECAEKSKIDECIYTDAMRNRIALG